MTADPIGTLWLFKEKYGLEQIPLDMDYEAYLKSLLICANGDGRLTDEEKNWVIGFAEAYNCNPSILEEIKNYKADEDIATVISRASIANQSRTCLIYDAIKACCADGDYHEEERSVVLKGAVKLGISEEVFKQIEEICLEEAKLREKRVAVLYPNGLPL